jgi:hypothetical protein
VLACTVRAVRELIWSGSIPALCIGKRQLLDRPDLEQLVDVARRCWSSTSTRALFPLSSKSPIFVLGAECIARS